VSIFKFNLGDELKDLISGFIGVASGRIQWINGCKRYVLDSTKLKDGGLIDPVTVDEQQLVLVKALKVDLGQVKNDAPDAKPPGGPRKNPGRSRSTPARSRSIARR
jgi:hypothetical protein